MRAKGKRGLWLAGFPSSGAEPAAWGVGWAGLVPQAMPRPMLGQPGGCGAGEAAAAGPGGLHTLARDE